MIDALLELCDSAPVYKRCRPLPGNYLQAQADPHNGGVSTKIRRKYYVKPTKRAVGGK
jgi:hypothetical protein